MLAISAPLLLSFDLGARPTPTGKRCGPAVMMPFRAMNAQQQAAKELWISKLDAPQWRGQASSTREVYVEGSIGQAWEAKLDAPSWAYAHKAVSSLYSDDANRPTEEEAKRAWLARLDVPTWGAVAAAVSEVSAGFAYPSTDSDEEAAKRAWLARLDAPSWGKAANALMDVAGDAAAVAELEEDCDGGIKEACDILDEEEEAKQRWLARIDAPTWGAVAKAVEAVAAEISSQPAMSAEEIAKHTWLAKTQAPSWGQGAGQGSLSTEEAAKQAWLEKVNNRPSWGPR